MVNCACVLTQGFSIARPRAKMARARAWAVNFARRAGGSRGRGGGGACAPEPAALPRRPASGSHTARQSPEAGGRAGGAGSYRYRAVPAPARRGLPRVGEGEGRRRRPTAEQALRLSPARRRRWRPRSPPLEGGPRRRMPRRRAARGLGPVGSAAGLRRRCCRCGHAVLSGRGVGVPPPRATAGRAGRRPSAATRRKRREALHSRGSRARLPW